MTSNYKRLGDYIRQVDVRNKELKYTNLKGINIEKQFMPSVANTLGIDLSNYKIVRKHQFACNLMHVGRDERIPIAFQQDDIPIIVSPAYFVFEILDIDILMPEYLMMWFSRSDFDRNAWFYTDADVRGGLAKDAMLDMTIPVPSISHQRELVAQYESLSRRIRINEQMIATLEETAQALYRKMFVEGIDKANLPEGWRMGTLGEVAEFAYGKLPNKSENGSIPVFSGYSIVGYTNEEMYNERHIVVIARGDSGSGKVVLSPKKFFLTNLAIVVLLKDETMQEYLYQHLQTLDTYSLRSGSAQAQVTINSMLPFEIVIPAKNDYNDFHKKSIIIHHYMESIEHENIILQKNQSILLTRLSKL